MSRSSPKVLSNRADGSVGSRYGCRQKLPIFQVLSTASPTSEFKKTHPSAGLPCGSNEEEETFLARLMPRWGDSLMNDESLGRC